MNNLVKQLRDTAADDHSESLFEAAADRIERLEAERLTLAKLASKRAEFFNPLVVFEAQKLRDAVLAAAKGGG